MASPNPSSGKAIDEGTKGTPPSDDPKVQAAAASAAAAPSKKKEPISEEGNFYKPIMQWIS